ncbi:MAG: hypothetical protein MRZ79_08670 [Bacteroidia bacterium]|nr:hypothetical protein [Bacteroidia bacterium]
MSLKIQVSILCFLGLSIFTKLGFAQSSDEITINAAFSSYINLNVTEGANINFSVKSIGDYTGGMSSPYNYFSIFEVSSSQNFKVDLVATTFGDGNGNFLDANNFGYRISDEGEHLVNVNHLLLGATNSPSNLALLGANTEIVTPTGDGNAGSNLQNRYKLQFELGTPGVRALSGLPRLLDQNISPASYVGTVTLTASAMP